MRNNSSIPLVLTLLYAMTLIGCGGNSGIDSVKGLSQGDADRLNAGRSSFDNSKDPPFTADTRFAAGQLAESQNVPAAAVEQYREALKINPNHEPSLYRLGVLLTQAKQYPLAIDTWKKYTVATKQSATGYSNLGFCYELSGNLAEAENAYRQGIAREPANASCRTNYGLMLARTGRIDQGLAQLQTVLSPAEAHYNVGSVLEQIGKKTEAREEYNKALKIDPDFHEAQKRLALLN